MNGQFREKDGRQLVIRDVYYDAQTTKQIGQIAQNSLAQIGVKLDLVTAAGGRLFTDYVTVGNFDIAQFAWGGRRVRAVLPDADLHHRRRQQLRQDQQPRDRRKDRARLSTSSTPTRRARLPTNSTS